MQARMQVVEKVGYIMVGTGFARMKARECGGMLPQEKFDF